MSHEKLQPNQEINLLALTLIERQLLQPETNPDSLNEIETILESSADKKILYVATIVFAGNLIAELVETKELLHLIHDRRLLHASKKSLPDHELDTYRIALALLSNVAAGLQVVAEDLVLAIPTESLKPLATNVINITQDIVAQAIHPDKLKNEIAQARQYFYTSLTGQTTE